MFGCINRAEYDRVCKELEEVKRFTHDRQTDLNVWYYDIRKLVVQLEHMDPTSSAKPRLKSMAHEMEHVMGKYAGLYEELSEA